MLINHYPIVPSRVYKAYWEFACRRQEIFFNRFLRVTSPWTADSILQKFKFTNAYRASDRVSQFLIRNVIYSHDDFSPEDQVFRILLFKIFNKIETWKFLESQLGVISFASYKRENYEKLLTQYLEGGNRLYSAAYIMPSGKSSFGFSKKHKNNLSLLELIMKDKISAKIGVAKSLKEIYELLLSYPSLGSFLAFQYSIDINYSELCDFSEMSFVVAGPGAKNGIKKCFIDIGKNSYEDIIRFMAESQEHEFERFGLNFKNLFGRPLQLIDCQNLFCETDKYARVAFPEEHGGSDRTRIKQQFCQNITPIEYFYPPKWGFNEKILMEEK
ncbi:hypothetical protein FACS189427_07890 [Planctomycetales bacterium]|nr:hypothetical protein FACS189427_07890 [Planctomycetales bacterium]